jgi:hypothetical protein
VKAGGTLIGDGSTVELLAILLSGLLDGGQAPTRKALVVDVPDGKGHMVLFGLRPYWRWQTQGTYGLGFNAILNWDHLDAGPRRRPRRTSPGRTPQSPDLTAEDHR